MTAAQYSFWDVRAPITNIPVWRTSTRIGKEIRCGTVPGNRQSFDFVFAGAARASGDGVHVFRPGASRIAMPGEDNGEFFKGSIRGLHCQADHTHDQVLPVAKRHHRQQRLTI